ncbi:plasmid maintenance protein [Borrelia turicatae]|uniref:plasmid maintenance protein n=1 Tax=Borrelia turicatae TaxID=142 RepID=UPI002ED6B204
MRNTKKFTNKYQHKLIVLISTLSYMNLKLKKYTQNNILYYFNNNIKKNGQKPIKLKTLQSYLYKLEKEFKVTINYHRHLGVNMGTEIHYKLKYSKKECYCIINKNFREKKEERHKKRVNVYFEKTCIKNSSVEKWECYYNNHNKEKNKDIKSIEKLQVKKYIKKCNFKSNIFYSILNLKLEKNVTIKVCKIIKKTENFIENNIYKRINSIKPKRSKQQELSKILNKTRIKLKNEGHNNKQLKTKIQEIYEQYKNKPHFIIENNKYNDLKKIIEKLKKTVTYVKTNPKEDEKNIKNNIFSILLDQLKYKIEKSDLVSILKDFLNKQDKLTYSKVLNNYYYHRLLELINNNLNYLKPNKPETITN